MTLTNITDLPDDVLRSEFPQIWIDVQRQRAAEQSNSDKTNIFLDQDNNQFYLQKNGSVKATRYNLVNDNKSLQHPELPETTTLNMDRTISDWGALDDQSIFDKTNKNWDEIRSYFQAMTRKINMFTDYLSALGPYLDKLAEKKDVDLSEILAEGESGYYTKSEVKNLFNERDERINNIQSKLHTHENLNGVYPPSYSGPTPTLNSDDKILNPAIRAKLEKMKEANNG